MAFQDLTWTSFVNTVAGPNPNDLEKDSGTPNVYDADAVSSEQIASAAEGVGIKFKLVPGITGGVAAGLTADNPDAHHNTIDYCILQWAAGGTVTIYENGVMKWDSGFTGYAGVLFTIKINATGDIEYYAGVTLLYTSLIAPSFPLFADASIDVYGVRVTDAQINQGVRTPQMMVLGAG